MASRHLILSIALLSLLGCQNLESAGFDSQPAVIQNPNPRVPLAALVRFDSATAVTTTIEVSNGATTQTLNFEQDPAEGLPILGLKPNRQYQFTVTVTDAAGGSSTFENLGYRTPALPAGLGDFPPINVRTSKPDQMEPGITFLSVRRRTPGRPHWLTDRQRQYITGWGMILAVDARGEVVWYYQADQRVAGIARLSNGNLLFHMTDFRTLEVDMLGNVVTEWFAAERPFPKPKNPEAVPIQGAQTLHHQPLETPSGTFMSFSANARKVANYYTSEYDPNAPRRDAMVMGDDVIEFNRNGKELWRWSTWDHLDPFRIGYELTEAYWFVRGFPDHLDWTHGNGLEYDARDDAVIINLRHQDALIKIDRKSGEIVWILGEPTDWADHLQDKLLTPVGQPFRWIYHAHNPRLTDSRSIVLFDNGKFQARPFRPYSQPESTYSRTVEFEVDEQNMTVRQLWASHDKVTPDNCYSYAMGDAHWLPRSGNYLVVDSICDYREPNLTQDEFDYSRRHIADVIHWGRVREYHGRENTEVVFEMEIRDPNEVLQWEIFGGFKTADLYHRELAQ